MRGLHPIQLLDLHRGVAYDFQQLLVGPHIALERRDVEVANNHPPGAVAWQVLTPGRELVQKAKLVSELFVDRRIRYIAAGNVIWLLKPDIEAHYAQIKKHNNDGRPELALQTPKC